MPSPRPAVLLRLFAVPLGIAAAVAAAAGCSTKPPVVAITAGEKKSEDPWPRAASELRRESELVASRRVLEQLRTDLVTNGDSKFQPVSLSADQEKAVQRLLGLTEREVGEIRPAAYSALDAHHLAECYYLRDVVRSLGVAGLPPERQARVAFDWLTRQMNLLPWITTFNGQRQVMPPAPPVLALSRGAGSGLERAYLFLGLLNQLGLDGCLIGPPEAAQRAWSYAAQPNPAVAPRGPFWAVGVRVGRHVYVYDPWRGEPVPGPASNTGGVATLAQLQADPSFLKAWRDDPLDPWAVPAADVARAVPFLAVPLSGLAPRFQRLESELRNDAPGVRLFTDAVALQTRFAEETKLPVVAFWNPAAENFSPTRSLASYVPQTEGGFEVVKQLYAKFRADLIPLDLFTASDALRPRPATGPDDAGDPGVPEAVERIQILCINTYAASFLVSPSPLERIQRGQFAEVTPLLIQRRTGFLAGVERLRTDRGRDDALAKWVATAKELYTKLLRARDRDPAGAAAAGAAVEEFWKRELGVVTALADISASEAGAAEATFLLALCRHEQAERAQLAYEQAKAAGKPGPGAERAREKAVAEWAEAAGWWQRYEPYSAVQGRHYPARPAQAARLAAAARTRLAQ